MENSRQLPALAEQEGMPSDEWCKSEAAAAYHEMCGMLTQDINTPECSNRAGLPRITILPIGNFACELVSRDEVLKCVAFGSIRKDLFVEVAWQNITRAQDKAKHLKIKTFEVSQRQILLDILGFVFSLRYIESPELVRLFPAIIDVPREIQSNLQAEAEDTVEALRDLEPFRRHIWKYPVFRKLYYSLRLFAISTGLFKDELDCWSLTISTNQIACLDGELVRELSWKILMNSENQDSSENLSVMVGSYLLTHQACLQSLKRDECAFYFDSYGPFARRWADYQFRIVHEEFGDLYKALTTQDGRLLEDLSANDLPEILQGLRIKPFSDKLRYHCYIRVTLQYSGQSQLGGTKVMDFVEERVLDLIQALKMSLGGTHLRPWPTRLVDIQAGPDDNPYEGYWLVGLSDHSVSAAAAAHSVLSLWNDKVCVDCRYSPATMVVLAELISREVMMQQELKEDPRKWPRPLAKPDPKYILNRNIAETSETTLSSKDDRTRKLRAAMFVLSRLKHDPAFELDDYVIGYTDRHAGIMEKAAGAWVTETTHEDWIPQGRIQYFKRVSDECRVWDRATKTDLVFK